MAKLSRTEIQRSLNLRTWVFWETVRRNSAYRSAVAGLIANWQNEVNGVWKKRSEWSRRNALQGAVDAFHALEGYAARAGDIDSIRGKEFMNREAQVMMIIDDGLKARWMPKVSLIEWKGGKSLTDFLPELHKFEQQWHLKFPVPSSISLPIDDLITTCWCRPVRIVSHSQDTMVLDVYPAVGIEIVSSCIRGTLLNFLPKRRRGRWMAWRLVSRKAGIAGKVTVEAVVYETRDQFRNMEQMVLRVTCPVSANLQSVVKTIKIRASEILGSTDRSNWRDRDYYRSMFAVVDLYGIARSESGKLRLGPLKKIATEVNLPSHQVRDRIKAFRALRSTLELP